MDNLLADFEGLLDAGDRLYADESYEDALRIYERSIKAGADDSQRAEGYCAVGDALLALGRAGEAIYMYAKAVDLDGEFAGGYCGQADVHYERWEFDKAVRQARRALQRDPDFARAHFLMGLIYEKSGEDEAARERFRRAAILDPEYYPRPLVIDETVFRRKVSEALLSLPDEARRLLADVPVEVLSFPSGREAARLREQQIGPQVPGLLLEEEGDGAAGPPLRLVLYRRNLEKMVAREEALVDEIRKTILHEIADLYGEGGAAPLPEVGGEASALGADGDGAGRDSLR